VGDWRISIEPIVLEGDAVRLEPLSTEHLAGLAEVGLAGDVFRWFTQPVTTRSEMQAFIQTALGEQQAGTALPFAAFSRRLERIVGSTRFANIDPNNRRVEIGWTWLAPAHQRTVVNTEAKYLMLRHAFESWGCNRVEFKTDSLNERSRKALLRIGAKEEGTLRNHMVTASGRLRHSVYFSIVSEDWPAVKAMLLGKLEIARPAA
jgi:RimJ/RimL family protein N-acetyltransferase